MIIIVGATSGIGKEIVREYAAQGKDMVLCGRDKKKLQVIVEDSKARGAKVHGIVFDAMDLAAQEEAIKHIIKLGKIEGMILVQGYMPRADTIDTAQEIRRIIDTNLSSVMNLCNLYLKHIGDGFAAVVTSIAGERGKERNLLYNAAKGGASIYLEGLRQKDIDVIDIRPGWIDTKMTEGIESKLKYPTDKAAKAIIKGIKKRKRVVYVPWYWRYIMLVLRNMPNFIWDKLKL